MRTKQFEPSDATEKALQIFWKNGYERTSMNDLVKGMGINRGSLYDTFGDKHALFLKCLERYSEVYMAQVIHALSRKLPVIPTLERLFSNVVELLHEDGCNWGCFMTNATNELSLHDEKVASVVSSSFEQLERAFAECIAHGIESGELRPELDPQTIGRFLTSAFVGLATLAKTSLPAPFMNDVIRTTLSLIK